jgi:hypothetical protein
MRYLNAGYGFPPDVRRGLPRGMAEYSRATPSFGSALKSNLVKDHSKGVAQLLRVLLRRGIATTAHPAAKPKRSWPLTLKES